MKELTAYLNFDGNAREAMTFYSKCLGAELCTMLWSAAPPGQCEVPPEAKDRIMHASLTKGSVILMAADTFPGTPFQKGNNFTININCESRQESERLFAALGEKGKVIMPLQDMFWGSFWGMLTDQFGINWMFSFEHPKKG